LAWGITGLAWFLWLGIEDRSVTPVLVVALLVSSSVVLGLPLKEWGWRRDSPSGRWQAALIGLLTGATVPLLATLLMFMKVSLHSHDQPDFSIDQVIAVLRTVPIWSISGGLVGVAWSVI
jgi:hypothetical protein